MTPSLPQNPRKETNPWLAGLSMGILLFALTLCTAGSLLMPGLSRTLNLAPAPRQLWTPPAPTAELPAAGQEDATPTPAIEAPTQVIPLPTVAAPTPSGPQTFKIGDTAVNANNGPVNLRLAPGYVNKPPSDRVGLVAAGDQVEIIGGPVLVDELVWWQVRWQGQEGWMAETRASGGRILQLP